MADIANLGNLNSAEPLDLDMYQDAKEGFELPKAGRYVVRAPESFPSTAFGATKSGFLSAQVDPTIVGPTNEGITIKYTKVSAKPFKRGGMTASQLGDYLRATGLRNTIPGDPQAQANAVEQTAGATYQVDLDWRAYSKTTGKVVEGMKSFPLLPDGSHQSWIEDDAKDPETGEAIRLRANLFVRRYVAAA